MSCVFFQNVDLQSLVKWIGKSDIFVQIFGVLVYSIALVTECQDFMDVLNTNGHVWNFTECNPFLAGNSAENATSCELLWSDFTGVSSNAMCIFVHIVELAIALKLIKGAEMRNERKCHKWLLMTVLLTATESVVNTGQFTLNAKNANYIFMYSIPAILLKLVSCGVVKSYVTEVRRIKGLGKIDTDPSNPLLA